MKSFAHAYFFPGRSLYWVEGGMLEPVAVVQIVAIEQLRKGMNLCHFLESILDQD
jgi:hypothetical protein